MDNTDPYKTKFKEERLYMSTNQNLMQHIRLWDRIFDDSVLRRDSGRRTLRKSADAPQATLVRLKTDG